MEPSSGEWEGDCDGESINDGESITCCPNTWQLYY